MGERKGNESRGTANSATNRLIPEREEEPEKQPLLVRQQPPEQGQQHADETTLTSLFAADEDETDLSNNFVVKTCQKFIPVNANYDGNLFVTIQDGVWKATPLLLTVAVIELSDIAFAVRSCRLNTSGFGVTRDPSSIGSWLPLNASQFLFALNEYISNGFWNTIGFQEDSMYQLRLLSVLLLQVLVLGYC
ncbi:hypothetical protein AAG906_014446 [Vitis piasezkii]